MAPHISGGTLWMKEWFSMHDQPSKIHTIGRRRTHACPSRQDSWTKTETAKLFPAQQNQREKNRWKENL